MKGNKINHAAALAKWRADQQKKFEARNNEPERPARGRQMDDHKRLGNVRTREAANASLKASSNPAVTNAAIEKAVKQHQRQTGLYVYGAGKIRKA